MNENLPGTGVDGAAEPGTLPQPAESTDPVVPVTPVSPVGPVPPVEGGAPASAARSQNVIAILATVVVVAVIAFGGGFATGRVTAPDAQGGTATGEPVATEAPGPGSSSAPSAGAAVTPVPSDGPDLPSDGARLGRADAPVVIDYWADYQCPFCSKFATESIPGLIPYIEDGTVQLVHRDFAFIGPESLRAAIAVRCADREDKYWPMHDAVYAAQDGENQGGFADAKLVAIGESIGLDAAALEACMDDHAVLVDVLDDTAAGHRVAIESTPTVDVNGVRLLGVPDQAKLDEAIAAAVAGATPAPLPTQAPTGDAWDALDTGARGAGDVAAPVRVELWMDYQSPDAKAIVETLEPELRTRASSGPIFIGQKDLALLGEESVTAAAAVRCTADQEGPAWLLHDVLAVNAPQSANSGIFTSDTMLRIAAQLGMDVKQFDACMASPATAEAVRRETDQGSENGLTKGPAIIVSRNGEEIARFTDAIDAAAVLKAIDDALKAGG